MTDRGKIYCKDCNRSIKEDQMDDVKIKVIGSDKPIDAINKGNYEINLSAVMALGDLLADTNKEDAENVAHWIALTECANEGVYCSHCRKKVYKLDYSNTMKVRSKFCSNCGFKMLPKVEEL